MRMRLSFFRAGTRETTESEGEVTTGMHLMEGERDSLRQEGGLKSRG